MMLQKRGAAGQGQADQAQDQRRRLGNDARLKLPHRAEIVGPAKLGRAVKIAMGADGHASKRIGSIGAIEAGDGRQLSSLHLRRYASLGY